MTKNQEPTIFRLKDFEDYRFQQFLLTDLGQLYQVIPFEQLANLLPAKRSRVGAIPWFNYEGYFGMMFLKAYLGLSDAKLIQRINTDWALQMFCGIRLGVNELIKDEDLPSRMRKFLGEHLDIESFQEVFIRHWKPNLLDTHCFMNDATVYESYIKYPTDVKLLWDCCVWVFEGLHTLSKELGLRKPRSKYIDQCVRQHEYQKIRKKTHKQTQRRKKALLHLLNKGIGFLEGLLSNSEQQALIEIPAPLDYKFKIIKAVYRQQKYLMENHTNIIQDRIVSLFKPYLRPIVRGKENKPVEFGMKVMISQVDGINFIDKLSFDPYNECKYLKNSIIKHKKRFGSCHQIGIDQIYGTNENRKYMKGKKICHCLVRKGKPSIYEEQYRELRKQIGLERATRLEGSFGNEKNHYSLRKVKARSMETEIIWVLFGIMTSNAIKMTNKINSQQVKKKAA